MNYNGSQAGRDSQGLLQLRSLRDARFGVASGDFTLAPPAAVVRLGKDINKKKIPIVKHRR